MADPVPAVIRIEELWDARYRNPGGDYVIAGVTTGIPPAGDDTAPLPLIEPKLFLEVNKDADFTLNQDDARTRFVCTSAITVIVPAVGTLGNGWECEILNDSGGSVTIDGPGDTDATLTGGQVAHLLEANGRQRVYIDDSTVIGDVFDLNAWDPSVFGVDFDLTHWWDATLNVTLDASTGKVSGWNDTVQLSGEAQIGTQTNTAKQPTWDNSNEIRFEGSGGKGIVTGNQGRCGYESKWFCMIFRIKWASFSGSDAFLAAVNGDTQNAAGRQLPRLNYYKATKEVESVWYTADGDKAVRVTVPGADNTWHTLIGRRTDDHIYLSIDGAAEVSLACYPRSFVPSGSSPTGLLGNGNTGAPTVSWGLSDFLQGQRSLSSDEIAKMHAWGMWRKSNQAALDSGSPYRLTQATKSRPEIHVETPDAYADGYRFPTSGGWDDSLRGQAISLTGYTRTFHDDFTDIATVTDGISGAGPWYAPAHVDTSNAKFQRPSQTPQVFSIVQSTYLQIKMQQVDNTGSFYSGHIETADVWGNGFLQSCPVGGSVYYEARMAFNGKGGNATTGFVTQAPSWPAFWLYSQEQYTDSAHSKCEIDVVEAYGASGTTTLKQIHSTAWLHGAYRPQSGNMGSPGNAGVTNRTPSKITSIDGSPFSAGTNLFNGQGDGSPGTFHTYGVKIDATWMTWYFDGKLVSRFATFKEALQPLFMLVSLQSLDLSSPANVETYLWIDYVDAWSHA